MAASDASRDDELMRLALTEARRGRGTAQPNPMVGAVIVRDGVVVAAAHHERAGAPHAEPRALARAGPAARGATMYVNLEPCSHFGRTPPCSDAVVAAGLARVVAAMIDPNPRVSGAGIRQIEQAGIDVRVGVLGEEAWRLNEDFIVYIREGRPLVTLKVAASLDGRIATRAGESQWITGRDARERVHALRHDAHAILTGRGTVLADDPALTCRLPGATRTPHRFVVDSWLATPAHARITDTAHAPTTIYCLGGAAADRRIALEARGVEVVALPPETGRVALGAVLADIASRGLISVLVEAGGTLAGALADAGFVDRVAWFTAPIVIGGVDARPSVAGLGIGPLGAARSPVAWHSERVGDDQLLIADYCPHLVPDPRGRGL